MAAMIESILQEPGDQTHKRIQLRSLREAEDGKISALGQDGIRREVSPFVSQDGQTFGWVAQEDKNDQSRFTAYPVDRPNTRAEHIIARAIARRVATGQMEITGNYQEWQQDSLMRRAVVLGYAIRQSHSSDHERFDISQYPQFQELSAPPSRRNVRVANFH